MNFVTNLFKGLSTKDKEQLEKKKDGLTTTNEEDLSNNTNNSSVKLPANNTTPATTINASEGNTSVGNKTIDHKNAGNLRGATDLVNSNVNSNDNDSNKKTTVETTTEGRQASISVSSTRSSSDEEEALLVRNIETGEVQNIDSVYDQFEYTTFSDGQITPKNSEGGDDLLSTSEREKVNAQRALNDNNESVSDGQEKVGKKNNDNNTSNNKQKVSVSLDSFHLNRVLGKGAFAKVLLVQKEDSGTMYAMKVLKKHHVARKNQIEHTRTERRILAKVQHPFICLLRYAFQTKKKLYLVLDYHPGGELFYHLSRRGRFREKEAKFFIAEITSALEYLHDHNICYRDLKPENVLIQLSGHIALTDFGLSKDNMESKVSGGKSFCGTPEYLAPEIIHRKGHGKAVDWWSLGMVSYELLTGLPPWYTKNRLHLFEDICWAPLRFARHVSQEARSLIRGLLTRDANDRFSASDAKANVFFADLDWDDVVNGKLKPIIIPSEGTSYISRDIRKLPVISTTEEGEDVETRGRERSINSTEFEGYSFEGMSGAPNKSGDVSIFEAAQKAAVGKGDRNVKLEVANNS
jgi:serine/threonine protein kinase